MSVLPPVRVFATGLFAIALAAQASSAGWLTRYANAISVSRSATTFVRVDNVEYAVSATLKPVADSAHPTITIGSDNVAVYTYPNNTRYTGIEVHLNRTSGDARRASAVVESASVVVVSRRCANFVLEPGILDPARLTAGRTFRGIGEPIAGSGPKVLSVRVRGARGVVTVEVPVWYDASASVARVPMHAS